jgi:hypothetical protein
MQAMTSKEIFEYGRLEHSPEEIKAHPAFSHVTSRPFCGCERILAYFRASNSPSGVVLVAGWSTATEKSTEQYNHAKSVFNRIYSGPTRGDIAARRWS